MDIGDWRRKVDEIDLKLVELLNQRASAVCQIGELKRNTQLPIYEPEREREVFDNIKRANRGPLPNRELLQVYERIIDVMRQIQKEKVAPGELPKSEATEIEVND